MDDSMASSPVAVKDCMTAVSLEHTMGVQLALTEVVSRVYWRVPATVSWKEIRLAGTMDKMRDNLSVLSVGLWSDDMMVTMMGQQTVGLRGNH